MAAERLFVHVASGDRELERAADGAISRSGAGVRRFSDAYVACAYFVRRKDMCPVAVLIGADHLTSDEMDIARYAHRAWPKTPIIIYGAPEAVAEFSDSANYLCSSEADLIAAIGRADSSGKDEGEPRIGRAAGASPDSSSRTSDLHDARRDSGILTTEELASLLGDIEI